MFVYYNPNPAGRIVGDCAVRAVAKALDIDWETSYNLICQAGFNMCDMPSSDSVWGAVLRQNGYYRITIPSDGYSDYYTAQMFANDHPHGTYILGFGGHVATVVDGMIYDAWDSSNEIPQYYWYRKEV